MSSTGAPASSRACAAHDELVGGGRVSRLGELFPPLPPPEFLFRSYLVTGERVIHVDRAALNAFLLIEWKPVLLTLGLFLFSVWALPPGRGTIVVLVGFIA